MVDENSYEFACEQHQADDKFLGEYFQYCKKKMANQKFKGITPEYLHCVPNEVLSNLFKKNYNITETEFSVTKKQLLEFTWKVVVNLENRVKSDLIDKGLLALSFDDKLNNFVYITGKEYDPLAVVLSVAESLHPVDWDFLLKET